MITLHTGKLGVGKSYAATCDVWKLIHKGKNCYVNWQIDFTKYFEKKRKNPWYRLWHPLHNLGKVYYWETMDDLYKLRNGEVFFDEAHMGIDARDFAKLPREFKTKLTQSRKYGLNLHFITQHSQQIDVAVRRLANELIHHTKTWRLFAWRAFDGENIESLANPLLPKPSSQGYGFHWFSKRFAKSYDTFALYEPFDNYKVEPMWDGQELVRVRKEARGVMASVPLQTHEQKGGDIVVYNENSQGNRKNEESVYDDVDLKRRLDQRNKAFRF